MTIGHHLLEGTLAKLPKPLAVLSRNAPPPDSHVQSILDPSSSTRSSLVKSTAPIHPTETTDELAERGDEDNGSFDVVALVKRKIVFSKRPVPITQGLIVPGVQPPLQSTAAAAAAKR